MHGRLTVDLEALAFDGPKRTSIEVCIISFLTLAQSTVLAMNHNVPYQTIILMLRLH